MEYALHIKNQQEIKPEKKISRIYVGNEFCSKLALNHAFIKQAAGFAKSEGLSLSILTSYCTENQLYDYKKVIDFVKKDCPEAEIVVNDWGVFNLCVSSQLNTVIGRLLVKQKNDPRIYQAISSLSPEAKQRSLAIGMNSQILNFLKEKRIKRIELNNVLQGINVDDITGFNFSLHLPFVFVSLTRYCGRELKAGPDEFIISQCRRDSCPDSEIFNKDLKLPLFRKGNAIFYKNESLSPGEFHQAKIDRVVYEAGLTA